ncbi:hypothetical protein [Stenotrophomonas sp.]|uniref:hypothetical protein n=1 Tax=Stenotrophomonas sp. TaxID=69392 RepID=UPI00289BF5C2|nr:hypothetical protein [Stenotrophomonas sp.]
MNTKISEAAIDAAARVLADARGHGMREKAVVLAEQVLSAALPHLHPQPAELAEQQGVHDALAATLGDLSVRGMIDDVPARMIGEAARKDMSAALAATGKQQVGEDCLTCNDRGWVGGPTFSDPAEGGMQCPDCNALDAHMERYEQQVGEVQGIALAALEASMPYLETLHSIVGGEARASVWRCIERGRAALAARQPVGQTFQAGVSEWMGKCFLPSLYSNMTERGDRLLEEVLELLQAHGYDQGRVATLVDYVFGRPAGEPAQEVGGVMVTLAGYCWVAGLDMHVAGEAELQRITQPEVMHKIRRKQEAKNALHFDTPLPGDAAATVEGWPREGDLVRYGDGSSALAIRLGPHAGGWHGYQCCGGYTFFTKAYKPSRADMDTWLDCAKYRDERTKAADSRVAREMYLIDQRDAAPGVG